jgi:hypothetical protein
MYRIMAAPTRAVMASSVVSSSDCMPDPCPHAFRCLPPLEYELLPASANPSGLVRLRFRPERLQYHAYAEARTKAAQAHATNLRLHEILSRLGEICLSPELAHAMLFPGHALAFVSGLTTTLDFPTDSRNMCHDPGAVLLAMDTPPSAQAPSFLAKFVQDSLPPPTLVNLRQPIHLCAWRLESPSRACLFTGQHPALPIDPADFTPHTLSKVLLEERSKRPTPSAIHLVTQDDISVNVVRKSLLHYAQTALTPHHERVGSAQAQDTTLEEAIACLIHAPTRNHTQIELNQSTPWDKDHIDSRCTHTRVWLGF